MSELCVGGPGLVVTGVLPSDASDPAVVLRDGSRVPVRTTEGVYDESFDVRSAATLPDRLEFTVAGKLRWAAVPGASEDVLTARCADLGR